MLTKASVLVTFILSICVPNIGHTLIAPYFYIIPDSLHSIPKGPTLDSLITSDNFQYRVWGLTRIGEIGDESDIDRLLEIYNKEPYQKSISVEGLPMGIKYFALRAIGKIGGVKAESILSSILAEFGHSNDEDTIQYQMGICDAFGYHKTENSLSNLEAIYSEDKYNPIVRTLALSNIYLLEVNDSSFNSLADTIDYLLTIYFSNYTGVKSDPEKMIKTSAVHQALAKITSPEAISLMESARNKIADIDQKRHLDKIIITMSLGLKTMNKK